MRFSLAYEMQRPMLDDHAVIEETIEQCILADEMGFDAVWFVEHHFLTTFSGSPCPEVIFGALSRLTKRIPWDSASQCCHITTRCAWRKGWQWLTNSPTAGLSSAPAGPLPTSRWAWASTPGTRGRCGTSP